MSRDRDKTVLLAFRDHWWSSEMVRMAPTENELDAFLASREPAPQATKQHTLLVEAWHRAQDDAAHMAEQAIALEARLARVQEVLAAFDGVDPTHMQHGAAYWMMRLRAALADKAGPAKETP